MADGNETNMDDDLSLDEISLESILAEYKGSAYINGDKKTPPELLNEQTERIISEALGDNAPDSLMDSVDAIIAENADGGIRNSEFGIRNTQSSIENDGYLQTYAQTNMQSGAQIDTQTYAQTNTQAGTQDYAQTNIQADAQTGMQNDDLSYMQLFPEAPQNEALREVGASQGGEWTGEAARPGAPERSANERRAAKRRAAKRNAAERNADERSADERSADERNADERNADERNASERSADERSADERSAPERSADERSAPERSAKNVLYLNVPTAHLFSDQQSGDGGSEFDDQGFGNPDQVLGQGSEAIGYGAGETDESGEEKDSVVLFFDNYLSDVNNKPSDTFIEDVENAVEREYDYGESRREPIQLNFDVSEHSQLDESELADVEEEEYEDEVIEEPDLRDAVIGFVEKFSSISLRIIPAVVIVIIMIILTLAAEAEMMIPFGIGRSLTAISGALMIMLLIVMMLCVEILVRGTSDLMRGAPNAETLILFSCAFSIISCVFTMLRGDIHILPYCSVSAVSLTLAAYGEKLNLRAITETLKTASISSEPYGVQAEYNEEINKSVLKKAYNRTDGFYSNLMHPDVAETAYRYAAPILLSAALVFAVVSVAAKGRGEYFLHTLSALMAAAAPFSAMLTFSIPFGIVVRSIRKSGAAIAGWGGVDDICFTDGASVTDEDLFPPGTLAFNGVKIYEGVPAEKAIRYTASLIIVSGSGLSRIFSEVLKTQKMSTVRVENFACYEGGVGARIQGEDVLTGSAAFMNLQGIRIPDDMNMKNAVFTAINNELIAMFAIEYSPINSVQAALISMLKWRIKLFFAMRDFNVTPLMLEQKFRVSLEDIEYIQAKDSYSISDSFSGKHGRMAALLAREGLGPYAEAITGGRLLKSAALVATAVSVISAALGLLFIFYMCWNGSFISAKPGNLLLFMLSTLAAVIIVCGYVKCKK